MEQRQEEQEGQPWPVLMASCRWGGMLLLLVAVRMGWNVVQLCCSTAGIM